MIVGMREGKPAVCVKDRVLWAHDDRTRDLIAELAAPVVDAIYEGVNEDFWRDVAPDVAREHGYGGEVFSAGHSGGWLILGDDLNWIAYVDARSRITFDFYEGAFEDVEAQEITTAFYERERFLAFAKAIDAAVTSCGETFIESLTDARAELEGARESCIVRSEN